LIPGNKWEHLLSAWLWLSSRNTSKLQFDVIQIINNSRNVTSVGENVFVSIQS